MMIHKDNRWHCKNYTDWVKSLPCCVSGHQADDPHHIKPSDGVKPSDIWTIPLTRQLHTELHAMGWQTFEYEYAMSQLAEARKTIDRAIREGVLKFEKVPRC